jgi:hypothetical protein
MQQFGVYKVAEIRQKYEQHIRLPTKIFEDKNFLSIPIKQRAYCLAILVCLLKFLNSKTLQCYPRVQTLVSMTGLSKRSVFRCLTLLVKANIIAKKRLKSTSLYTIHSNYVVSTRHQEVPHRHHLVPDRHVLKEPITRTNINITTKVDEIIKRGLPKDVMINEFSTTTPGRIRTVYKKHPYYIPKAIERKEELDRQKNLVPVEKVLSALKNVGGKKSNAFYRAKIDYNKRNNLDWKGNPKK